MLINYDKEKINTALKDFVNATGINVQFLKADLTSLGMVFSQNSYCAEIQKSPKGHTACANSDKLLIVRCAKSLKPEMRLCHAGLADLAVPVIYENELIGYLILGQMKTDKAFEDIQDYLASIGTDTEKLNVHYSSLPVFTEEKIKSIGGVAEMLAKFILLENMLKPSYDLSIRMAVEYIENNLSEPLSVEDISRKGNISKNTLYRGFKKEFGMTVSEYITKKRIEAAERLLINTDMSVEQIAAEVGFSTAAYFGANFKKLKGVSPLRFRKERKDR